MAFVFPILSAVGTVVGAFSQAGAQSAAGQAQANAAYYNAAVAQNNANAAMQAAYAEKQTQDRKDRMAVENVRSKYLSSGIELEGTPLLVLSEEVSQRALESEKIIYRGKVQATQYQNEAGMYQYQGDTALAMSSAKSDSTILGGIFSGVSGVGRAIYSNS
jgi:hypothetical protein